MLIKLFVYKFHHDFPLPHEIGVNGKDQWQWLRSTKELVGSMDGAHLPF